MAKAVHVPWYATLFRGDQFELALMEIAPLALRYGATEFSVHRNGDDRYKFLQISHFETKLDWERYWSGPEFVEWRGRYSSWFQVPIVYAWNDIVATGLAAGYQKTEPSGPGDDESADGVAA